MNEEGFFVNTDMLRDHADAMDTISDHVDLAADAGREVTPILWDNAYGVLCQGFPTATKPLALVQIGGLRFLADRLGETAGDIRASAAMYDAFENGIADEMKNLIDKLLGPR